MVECNMVPFLVAVMLLHVASASVNSSSLLWPIPEQVTPLSSDVRMLDPDNFNFITVFTSDLVNKAFQRYKGLIFERPTPFYPDGASQNVQEQMLILTVIVYCVDETLNQDTDESYMLDTEKGILVANTVYGMLRGLETFSQLVYKNTEEQFLINSVMISDAPRFKFRATMIDSSRHFLHVSTILDHLDAMSYNKFNVLHWHIVDDQSFPYTSIAYPNLIAGAFSKNHVYSQDDIAMVIKYAKYRGIRVIVEFDTPGHTQSWDKGQPDLLTKCYNSKGVPSGSFGPINPILTTTWTFLNGLFDELSKVFPDDYLHLGGDEVSFSCWMSNPQIQKWMQDNNYTDYSKLEQYYETRLLKLAASKGKKYIVWQEIFDNKIQVLPDTVMNVWKGNWQNTMFNITKVGLNVILSTCWYLNYISYGEDWTKYYMCDPQDFNGTDAQNKLVIGGEACMWAEFVDATNLLSLFWPRGCTVAERLWSPRSYNNTNEAYPRLNNMRCRLVSRDIPAQPLRPGYCAYEWSGKGKKWN